MHLLQDRDSRLSLLDYERRGSFFFETRLMQYIDNNTDGSRETDIRKFTRRVDILSYDSIYLPTNIRNIHWTLVVIKVQLKEIHYYDSMNGKAEPYTNNAMKWFASELRVKYNTEIILSEWKTVAKKDIPQQMRNGNECGMFTIMCADFLSDDLPLTYQLSEMAFFRQKVAADILRGHLKYNVDG